MLAILLTIYVIVVVALVAVVLLQRSEGGALGIGGGGGGMMSGRGAANLLTRSTSVLGGLFMVMSLVIAMVTGTGVETDADVIRDLTGEEVGTQIDIDAGEATAEDLLDSLDSLGTTPTEGTPAVQPDTPSEDEADTPAEEPQR